MPSTRSAVYARVRPVLLWLGAQADALWGAALRPLLMWLARRTPGMERLRQRFPGLRLPLHLPAVSRARIAAALVWADRALHFCARWGVPGALGFLILSGPILPRIGGGLTPYAGLRSLHVLAGLGLSLAVLYQAAKWGVQGAIGLAGRIRRRPRSTTEPAVRGGVIIASLHHGLLAMMLWAGFERYIGQRWGRAVLPVLTAAEWGLAHRLLAPYYLSALLIYWFVKSRIAWRTVLDQLRRP